jgi:hypothetical protein
MKSGKKGLGRSNFLYKKFYKQHLIKHLQKNKALIISIFVGWKFGVRNKK